MVWERGVVLGLSGRKSLEEIFRKDILDSLLIAPHLHPKDWVLDIGSGAGFPGIPLKIAVPDLGLCLLDSRKKAVKFLREVIRNLGLEAEVLEGRAEVLGQEPCWKGKFSAVLGRAVAPLPQFIRWACPFLRPGGKLLLQKGKKLEEELARSATTLRKFSLFLDGVFPGLEGDQRLVILKKS